MSTFNLPKETELPSILKYQLDVTPLSANILVVDDHIMVIEGMKAILEKIECANLIASAMNSKEAIEAIKTHPVDVAFIDINMPETSGIELCEIIKNNHPYIHVIALSTFKQRSYVSEMIRHGAVGYLLKSAGKEEIEEAIIAVTSGKLFISPEINKSSPGIVSPEEPPTLTQREKEILKFISEGLTNNSIAEKIFISAYTVDTHRKNLLSKFQVNNTAMLIKKAADYGFL